MTMQGPTRRPQTIDSDQIVAEQRAISKMGEMLGVATTEAAYFKIKWEAVTAQLEAERQANSNALGLLAEAGVDIDGILSGAAEEMAGARAEAVDIEASRDTEAPEATEDAPDGDEPEIEGADTEEAD